MNVFIYGGMELLLTYKQKKSAAMVDMEGESLIRDVRVQFIPERTVTAEGKSRVNRHASETRIGLMDSSVPIEALL